VDFRDDPGSPWVETGRIGLLNVEHENLQISKTAWYPRAQAIAAPGHRAVAAREGFQL